MLPWNYGFHWNSTTVIFLGAFYTVLILVAATVLIAAMRARRDIRRDGVDSIRWRSDFHDLPTQDRACRHVLTGELKARQCPQGFDCRKCETHATLVKTRPAARVEREEEVVGMSFPLDRFYHRGHTWAHLEPDGTMTVGLDDLGRRLLAGPDAIDLPKPGLRVRANGTAFRVRKRNADVRVLCPVDGEVIETGGPESRWQLRVRPDPLDVRHLLQGSEIRPWVMREMERLQLALAAEGAAPTIADGGVPVADVAANYPDADWDAVCSEIFLQG